MTYILYYILLSYSLGISSPCSNKQSLYLKLQKDTVYTYQNSINVTTWPRNNEANAKNAVNNFKSMMYPLSMSSRGYKVSEVISSAQNNDLLELIAKPPVKLPVTKEYPFYPVAQLEGAYAGNPAPLKSVVCEKVFKMSEDELSSNGDLAFTKVSINKVAGTETREFKDKEVELLRLESRKDVALAGKMEGTGTEKVTIYLIADTREPYEEIRTFKYEYITGDGENRKAEVMAGEYRKKLLLKEKYKKPAVSFPELTTIENKVPYYTNGVGLFVPVTLDATVNTKMYIIPTSESSFIDYGFYAQNFPEKPKNYFYPIDKMDVGGNNITNPGIQVIKGADVKVDYKIPGVIGRNIISKSTITINDKKRTFSISEPGAVRKIPSKSLLFDLVNNIPVFELTVNGSTAKTTISFDTDDPQISRKLVKQLGLKTIKIAGSKDRPEENIVEKVDLIITPTDRTYFKTQATVKDFGEDAYDFKLGLNYIKGKELIINYKDTWLLLRDAK
jgi:hypothetical protein